MNEVNYEGYHRYLLQRGYGFLYRRYYLYPRISRFLKGKVLDIGCGIGDFLTFSKMAVGIDINPYNVNYCRKHGLEAYLIDGNRFPFEDSTFDSAIMENVLEHLVKPELTLSETYRVLKPSGTLVVGIPGILAYTIDPDHKHFYDEKTLIRLMKKAGFKSIKVLHMPFKSKFLDKKMRQYCIYGIFQRDIL